MGNAMRMPTVADRQEGTWALTLTEEGKTAFQDSKAVSVLNTHPRPQTPQAEGLSKLSAKNLFVFDPAGTVGPFLKSSGLTYTPLTSLKALPEAGRRKSYPGGRRSTKEGRDQILRPGLKGRP